MDKRSSVASLAKSYYAVGIALMVVGILYVGKPVLMPVALSILLAFVLSPLVLVLEKWKLGRVTSVIIASCLAFIAIGLASWALAGQLNRLAKDLPNHEQEIREKLATFRLDDASTLGRLNAMWKDIVSSDVKAEASKEETTEDAGNIVTKTPVVVPREDSPQLATATDVLSSAVEPFAMAALIIVLVLFILIRREDIRFRVISLMGANALTGTTRLMRDTAERVSNYLFHLLLVNAAFGLWFAIGLYFLKVPYAPLWGFLTLFLRFIPFLGSPASVIFPLLISIATSTGWSQPMGILVFFGISELLTANVIEPILFGKSTGLTPIALLIAALFWAWIWGPVGLLLSTPLTVCLVVLGQHLPALHSLKVLLAEQPVLDAKLQYFQRLLANDAGEADKLVSEYVKTAGIERTIDEVLVPALRWTRLERQKGSISTDEEKFVYTSMAHSIAGSLRVPKESSSKVAAQETGSSSLDVKRISHVVGYPVHHESEEVAIGMLQLIADDCCSLTLLSTKQLPSKVLRGISASKPDVVVLTVLPPGGLHQVKYMCAELQKCSPNTQIIVTFLGAVKNYDQLLVRMRKSGVSYLATSISQTHQMIAALCDEKNRNLDEADSQTLSVVPIPHSSRVEKRLATEFAADEVTRVG